MTSTIVHIGFHKTGTTALQELFFPGLKGCAYVGPRTDKLLTPLCRNLAQSDEGSYLRTTVKAFVEEARGEADRLLLSHESLSRHHAEGRTAARLQDSFPGARILVVVRNQITMLWSLYHQYLKHGGTRPFARWATSELDLEWIRYDVVVGDYQELFSPERVTVKAYEQLVADPATFLADVRGLVVGDGAAEDVPSSLPRVNVSVARPSSWVFRNVNRLLGHGTNGRRVDVYPTPVRRLMLALRDADSRHLSDRYRRPSPRDEVAVRVVADQLRSGNARLQAQTGLDLSAYGYPLPDAASLVRA